MWHYHRAYKDGKIVSNKGLEISMKTHIPLVLLLSAHLLIIGKFPGHLAGDSILPTHGDTVLQVELGVAVRESQ